MKFLLKNIPQCIGLVLIARYKNQPNLVLAKLQTAITFSCLSELDIFYMVLGYKNEIYDMLVKKNTRVSWFGPGCRIQKAVKSSFDKTSN